MSCKLDFPTRRHFYYALARTLYRGSPATDTHSFRSPLPIELIVPILRDAECTVLSRLSQHVGEPTGEVDETPLGSIAPQIFPSPDLAKMGWPLPLINPEEIGKKVFWKGNEVISYSGNPTWKNGFSSPPINARNLVDIHSMQLLTRSKGVGWEIYPSGCGWSWFDIFLISKNAEAGSPKKHLWRISKNAYPDNPIQRRTGANFGPNHEIWRVAQVGDRIGVRVWLRDSEWRDIATMALLIIQEYFVPSFV